MKKATNCPNCGAPIDRSRDSCEYCGTPYPEKPETAKFYADNQLVMEVQIEANKNSDKLIKELIDRDRLLLKQYKSMTAWQPTPEEERKMIEDMRNVAPTIFPKVEERVDLIDKFKYEREKELLHDILGVFILLGPAIVLSVITWFFNSLTERRKHGREKGEHCLHCMSRIRTWETERLPYRLYELQSL